MPSKMPSEKYVENSDAKEIKLLIKYVENGNLKEIKSLMNMKNNQLKENILHKDKCGRSLLYKACSYNHIEIVKWFIILCKDKLHDKTYIMERDILDNNMLCHAIMNMNIEMVQLLIENGNLQKEDILKRDRNGCSALHKAFSYNCIEIVNLLIELCNINNLTIYNAVQKEDIIGQNNHETTSLHEACKIGNIEIVNLLLELYANKSNVLQKEYIMMKDVTNKTAFYYAACTSGNIELVKLLIEKGNLQKEDIMMKIQGKRTILYHACMYGYTEFVELLLTSCGKDNLQKEDILTTDSNGQSALFIASYYGFYEIVDMLITMCCNGNLQKEDIMIEDRYDNTAYNVANVHIKQLFINAMFRKDINDIITYIAQTI